MWLSQLALANFRNYVRLGLDLAPGVILISGRNGHGKSNLLEAVSVLATTRSPRTSADRELVTWRGDDPELVGSTPFARLEGRVRRPEGEVHIEVLFRGEVPQDTDETAEPGPARAAPGELTGRLARRVTMNGLPTRAADLIGRLAVVHASPETVDLVSGAPAGRRRYLDLANSQVAPLYLRALQQYGRIVLQRNLALRQVRERRQPRGVLEPWTEQLVRTGSFIVRQRLRMVRAVGERAAPIFAALTGSSRILRLAYRASLLPDSTADHVLADADPREVARRFTSRLEEVAAREVEQAASLVGPHRDDLAFLLDGVDLTTYGSRGQQRLAVLALKLAEAEWMEAEIGASPVLLLDDVFAELDSENRSYVQARLTAATHDGAEAAARQVWLTTADADALPADLRTRALRLHVDAGTVRRA